MSEKASPAAAFLLAGLAALGFWVLVLAAYIVFTDGPVRAAQVTPYLLMGAVLLGVPAVLAVLLLIAVPVYLLMRRIYRITLPVALVAGGACGLVVRAGVRAAFGQPESAFVPVPVVVVAGVLAALVWWNVWTRPGDHAWLRRGAL